MDLLTMDETAQLLRVPVATLRYWVHLGTGPKSLKMGRRRMFRRQDVEAYVASLVA